MLYAASTGEAARSPNACPVSMLKTMVLLAFMERGAYPLSNGIGKGQFLRVRFRNAADGSVSQETP